MGENSETGEQTRRDAEVYRAAYRNGYRKGTASEVHRFADAFLSAYAELDQAEGSIDGLRELAAQRLVRAEQAERERDEAKDDAKRWQNRATLLGKERQSVPALVEALRWIRDPSYVGNYGDGEALEIHRKWAARALARYEQSLGNGE